MISRPIVGTVFTAYVLQVRNRNFSTIPPFYLTIDYKSAFSMWK